MLKFFRRFRKKYLDQNKIRKYLFYSLGEIILVVLGILIALQVNNWNEQRIDSNRKDRYVMLLISDLENDLNEINIKIEAAKKDTTDIGAIRDQVSSKEATVSEIKHIYIRELSPYIPSAINFNNTTFNAIESSGDLQLFSADIVRKLTTLSNMQKAYQQYSLQNLTQYKNSVNDIVKKYPSGMYTGSIENGSVMSEKVWAEIDEADFISDLNGILITKYITGQLYLARANGLRENTHEVLELLKGEIRVQP